MNENRIRNRFTAAVELEKARDTARVCARVGRVTTADRLRVSAAETAWDMQQILQWQVTS